MIPESTTRRPRWLRRTNRLVTLAVVLALTALVVPDSGTHRTEVALVKINSASGVDVNPDVVWILMVGSDARPGEDMTRTRGDALQLVGVNTKSGAATAIGFPRDSWVAIPGVGSNRVNAALYYGGPELLGETVGNMVGIQPEYVMVTRFPFFENLINDIGGITVDNPFAFSDVYLKAKGFKEGRIHLNGYDAMAFSRIRKSLPSGDFGRSANQQITLEGIAAKIRARADEPGFLERGVLSVMQNLDTTVSPAELFRLAEAAAQIDPKKITHCVVQGGIGNVGGASVVIPNLDMARRFGADARKDATIDSCG